MPVMILPVLILSGALAAPVAYTREYCGKGKCERVQVSNRPTYGGLYSFRETPGGREFVVYSGPLGTVPSGKLAMATGDQAPPTAHFVLVSATPNQ